MKTSKHYIDLVNHYTGINGASNLIETELRNINEYLSYSKTKTTTQAIYDYLTSNSPDLYDFSEDYKYERDASYNAHKIDKDDFLSEVIFFMNEPMLADARVIEGFKAGLIDCINNAYMKTDRGWINDEQEVVLPVDASIEDIRAKIANHARVIPSFNISQLEQAEKSGECYIHGRLAASKNENNQWVDHASNRTFADGELIRLLHHKRDPIAIMTGVPEEKIYHSTVTDSKKQEDSHITREGSSAQGDGVYMTASPNEAIKIYGNPYSYEVRGKLLNEHEQGKIDRDKFIFGHIYEADTTASLYKASMNPRHTTFNDFPSPSVIQLVAKENGTSVGFANNWWMKMKSSSSTYDVYTALNEFSARIRSDGGDSNAMNKILSSMGFQGIEIKFPTNEQVSEYKERLSNLENLDQSDFTEVGIGKKPVINEMTKYIERLIEGIPAKAENAHVIVFDSSMVNKKYLGILPLNKKVLGKDDLFYSRDKKITLSDVGLDSKEKTIEVSM